jgi:histidine decarboxylase
VTDYPDNSVAKRLDALKTRLQDDYLHYIGFPGVPGTDFAELAPLLPMLINNVGDPYVGGFDGVVSKDFEQEVLAFFADLFRAPKDHWGYLTTGGTEGNLYALYLARQKYPEATVYYSQAAHYSIPKCIHILAMRGIVVKAHGHGEMDYQDLHHELSKRPGQPAIIVATAGTTLTEAHDDLTLIARALRESGVREHFIHADAAMAGIYAALLEPRRRFDFGDGADSLSVSGHKFIGAPMPCGVVLVHSADKDRLVARSNYTGSVDTTITGSRSGHAPLYFWLAIQQWGLDGLRRRAQGGQQVADYAHKRLLEIGWRAWRNPGALTVVLASPRPHVISKWQLASADGWSHIVCMPGISREKVDAFIDELVRTR